MSRAHAHWLLKAVGGTISAKPRNRAENEPGQRHHVVVISYAFAGFDVIMCYANVEDSTGHRPGDALLVTCFQCGDSLNAHLLHAKECRSRSTRDTGKLKVSYTRSHPSFLGDRARRSFPTNSSSCTHQWCGRSNLYHCILATGRAPFVPVARRR